MNGKQAKRLRRAAAGLMCEFVKEKVLPEHLTEGMKCGSIIGVLPERMYVPHPTIPRMRHVALMTRRYFIKQVKKDPEVTYEQIKERVYGRGAESEGSDDRSPAEEGTPA